MGPAGQRVELLRFGVHSLVRLLGGVRHRQHAAVVDRAGCCSAVPRVMATVSPERVRGGDHVVDLAIPDHNILHQLDGLVRGRPHEQCDEVHRI